jgi:hypothetical protein
MAQFSENDDRLSLRFGVVLAIVIVLLATAARVLDLYLSSWLGLK